MRRLLLASLLILVVGISGFWAARAAQDSEVATVRGLGTVTFSTTAPGVSATYVGQGTLADRASFVAVVSVGGMPVTALVRVTRSQRGTHLDLVLDPTIADLSSRATALNLTGLSHPAAARDATDTVALVAAGGS